MQNNFYLYLLIHACGGNLQLAFVSNYYFLILLQHVISNDLAR